MRRPWLRRIVTVSIYTALLVTYVALFPALLPAALLVDLVRRSRLALTRVFLFTFVYLACEQVGVWASAALWAINGGPFGDPHGETYHRRHVALQRWWSETLYQGIARLLPMTLEVEGEAEARPGEGPLLVFIRHAGMIDTVLPSHVIANTHHVHLRFVLSENLLPDPCLDIVGHRLGNVFVKKQSDDPEAEVARIAGLLDGLGDKEGVIIYPEGMRLTPVRRERVFASLERRGEHDLLERSQRLTQLMPPQLGGPLGLLEANTDADVLFFAHAGLDPLEQLGRLLDGTMVDCTVRVKLWRVPREEIPQSQEDRIDWLFEHWYAIDDWVDAQLEELGVEEGG